MKFERQILLYSLLSGAAAVTVALWLLWRGDFSQTTRVTLSLLVVLCWLGFAFSLRSKLIFPLRTLTNLVEALRENDYSMRVRGAGQQDALSELVYEVNTLAQFLQDQRFDAVEATALMRKIMAEIDIALFGFNQAGHLQLINESGRRLLDRDERDLLGRAAADLGLADCLQGPDRRLLDLTLPTRTGRWELRRATYRNRGVTHQLVFLSDLTRTLHAEERKSWQRLIQILRHEINNSLTPIQSVAGSLNAQLKEGTSVADWEADIAEGLGIIAERSETLGRFIASYSQLTRLPEPSLAEMAVQTWIHHCAGLETRLSIEVLPGPERVLAADRSQLDQLLINLISNAVEASLETHPDATGCVILSWKIRGPHLHVWIDDDGPGLPADKDLFIPFFTTKPEGSGIGLALSRQIAEAHGGELSLANRKEGGCRALLLLPL